jgi:hypothetical protein
VVAVAEFLAESESVLVAGDGVGVLAELVVGVAEAVPAGGLPDAIAELLEQTQRLPAGVEGLLVLAESPTLADRAVLPGNAQ